MHKETNQGEEGRSSDNCFTPTPYDAFFKAAFADSRSAADLVRNFLPEDYSRRLEEAEVSVDVKDYINRYLTEHQSDLLVACRNKEGRQFHFYFLYEHKSSPERETLLLLARALIELTFDLLGKRPDRELKEGSPATPPAKSGTSGSRWLPEIIPVILYHGTRRWTYPKQFSEQIDSIDEKARHLLRFEPFFIGLQSYRDEQFTGSLKTVVALMVLKNLSRRLDRKAARNLIETMYRRPVPPHMKEFYNLCYTALSLVKDEEEYELLLGEMEKAGYTEEEERAMTYAEAAEKRGIEKGKEEGKEEGREAGRIEGEHKTLIRLLEKKFGLSEEEKELVRSTEELEKIEAALDELLDAEMKEQVLVHLR